MQPLKKDKTYEILFIGNSYTFFNSGVPAELKALATCAGYSVNVDSVTKGGYALEQFADVNGPMGQQVREKLLEKRYDFVVLQEQSHTPITNPERFCRGVRSLAAKVRAIGAAPVLYATWGRRAGNADIERLQLVDNETMTWRLAAAYEKMGKEFEINVAHAGISFFELYTKTDLELYHEDGSHPSPTGTYTAAMTIFCKIFRVPTKQVTYGFDLETAELEKIKSAVETAVFCTPSIPEKYLEGDGGKE